MSEQEIMPGVFVRQIAAPDIVLRFRSGGVEQDVVVSDLFRSLGILPKEIYDLKQDVLHKHPEYNREHLDFDGPFKCSFCDKPIRSRHDAYCYKCATEYEDLWGEEKQRAEEFAEEISTLISKIEELEQEIGRLGEAAPKE